MENKDFGVFYDQSKNSKNNDIGRNDMIPSDYWKIFPYNSIMKKVELEVIFQNIIIIMARNGDTWRKLTYQEYSDNIDSGVPQFESDFNKVVDYTVNEEMLKKFSPAYRKE